MSQVKSSKELYVEAESGVVGVDRPGFSTVAAGKFKQSSALPFSVT